MMEYDVIIVGGGITGAGTARDCAMRASRHFSLRSKTSLRERQAVTTVFFTVVPAML